MGTDIHGVFQRYDEKTSSWEFISSEYDEDRHYQLFAVLAGVRNGRGFAGVPTGEAVQPIAELRGLPEDLLLEEEDSIEPVLLIPREFICERRRKWYAEPFVEYWLGDHSHSWLTGEEMLEYRKMNQNLIVSKTGVISRETYEKWDGSSEPEGFCGGIWGQEVITINDSALEMEKNPNWTHVQVYWDQPLMKELDYFFDEIQRLVEEHGKIRFVFGFDS